MNCHRWWSATSWRQTKILARPTTAPRRRCYQHLADRLANLMKQRLLTSDRNTRSKLSLRCTNVSSKRRTSKRHRSSFGIWRKHASRCQEYYTVHFFLFTYHTRLDHIRCCYWLFLHHRYRRYHWVSIYYCSSQPLLIERALFGRLMWYCVPKIGFKLKSR